MSISSAAGRLKEIAASLWRAAADNPDVKRAMHEIRVIANTLEIEERMRQRAEAAEEENRA